VLGSERLELAHERPVSPECKVGFDSLSQCGQPKLLEPLDLRVREGVVREIGESRSAPEAERFAQPR
jgi:hypothetical protein